MIRLIIYEAYELLELVRITHCTRGPAWEEMVYNRTLYGNMGIFFPLCIKNEFRGPECCTNTVPCISLRWNISPRTL